LARRDRAAIGSADMTRDVFEARLLAGHAGRR
jgi:hypothetical protein